MNGVVAHSGVATLHHVRGSNALGHDEEDAAPPRTRRRDGQYREGMTRSGMHPLVLIVSLPTIGREGGPSRRGRGRPARPPVRRARVRRPRRPRRSEQGRGRDVPGDARARRGEWRDPAPRGGPARGARGAIGGASARKKQTRSTPELLADARQHRHADEVRARVHVRVVPDEEVAFARRLRARRSRRGPRAIPRRGRLRARRRGQGSPESRAEQEGPRILGEGEGATTTRSGRAGPTSRAGPERRRGRRRGLAAAAGPCRRAASSSSSQRPPLPSMRDTTVTTK